MRLLLLTLSFIFSLKNIYAQSYNCARVGIGYQGLIIGELGYSHLVLHDKGVFGGSYCFHGSIEGNYKTNHENIYGVKFGYENCWAIFLFGGEAKFLSNFSKSAPMFLVKGGISFFGAASLTYGYNIKIPESPFPGINNQLLLSVNLGRKLWKEQINPAKTNQSTQKASL